MNNDKAKNFSEAVDYVSKDFSIDLRSVDITSPEGMALAGVTLAGATALALPGIKDFKRKIDRDIDSVRWDQFHKAKSELNYKGNYFINYPKGHFARKDYQILKDRLKNWYKDEDVLAVENPEEKYIMLFRQRKDGKPVELSKTVYLHGNQSLPETEEEFDKMYEAQNNFSEAVHYVASSIPRDFSLASDAAVFATGLGITTGIAAPFIVTPYVIDRAIDRKNLYNKAVEDIDACGRAMYWYPKGRPNRSDTKSISRLAKKLDKKYGGVTVKMYEDKVGAGFDSVDFICNPPGSDPSKASTKLAAYTMKKVLQNNFSEHVSYLVNSLTKDFSSSKDPAVRHYEDDIKPLMDKATPIHSKKSMDYFERQHKGLKDEPTWQGFRESHPESNKFKTDRDWKKYTAKQGAITRAENNQSGKLDHNKKIPTVKDFGKSYGLDKLSKPDKK